MEASYWAYATTENVAEPNGNLQLYPMDPGEGGPS